MLAEFNVDFKDGFGLGKVIFGLVDLPIGRKFKTYNGNFVERIDNFTVLLAGSVG